MESELTRLKRSYQRVFQGEAGVIVLSDILSLLGYFSNVPSHIDPERIAIANTILSRLNVYSDSGVGDFVKAIVQQAKPPVDDEDREDDE